MEDKYTIVFIPIERMGDYEATWGITDEVFETFDEAMCRRVNLCRSHKDVYYSIIKLYL